MCILVAHDWFCPCILGLAIVCRVSVLVHCQAGILCLIDGARINKQPTLHIVTGQFAQFLRHC